MQSTPLPRRILQSTPSHNETNFIVPSAQGLKIFAAPLAPRKHHIQTYFRVLLHFWVWDINGPKLRFWRKTPNVSKGAFGADFGLSRPKIQQ